ncbi:MULTISPECIES: DUF5597 domain-containing protein [Paenibacillus]|uniref:DUF5597 domain-containing protein n=1 Tax=Paenibacillus polymyxa TaxID=1406 RepID=A0AAP3ZXP8_PAEPO|nr:DUF5597 domain-containing protein [Paenibacillus polymyxa]MDH2331541.1 DUF5597 domain-containing protein [Paenibacillus polymyxa]
MMSNISLMPQLKKENGIFNLYVDGNPFIALAGEIHNSSASDLNYMKHKVWPQLRELHLNTVIVPVYWELIEPMQGEFDFHLVDGIIEQAQEENLRLVFLWFGLWKNGKSSYVPSWVKRDYETYFRAVYQNKESSDTISPLCEKAVEADAAAFRYFMAHLKKVDGDRHTVIMVQVENEIGFLGSDRDYSDHANEQFNDSIPDELAAIFGKVGSWKEAFADDAEEYFMAFHYARAIERIASSGSDEYALPMFVNAWLEQFPWKPGSFPSGGPIAKVMQIWKVTAPTICLYAPDIYVPNFAEVCEEYTAGNDNPLFIPETRRDVASVTNVFYAIGKHNALCFSPFGIESIFAPPSKDNANIELGLALNIDFSAFVSNGTGPYLARSYELLGNMQAIIQKYRGTGKMTGFIQNHEPGCILSFTKYDLKVNYQRRQEGKPVSGGLVIEASDNEFILVGIGCSFEFLPKRGDTSKVDYISIEEGTFVKDKWIRGRVLNGDEASYRLAVGSNPSAFCVEMYQYR